MADNIMHTWYDAAKKRVSVRSYSAPIDRDMFYVLKSAAMKLCNDEARIDLRAKNGVLGKIPVLSAVIGGVDGTNCFAAIIVKKGCEYMGGYIGEAFILECVSRGLATCWLGATYKKKAVKEIVEMLDDEKLIGIIAIGKCDQLPENGPRKSIEQLTGVTPEDFQKLPQWQQEAAKMARIAPSARNCQPWELEIKPGSIRLICNSDNFGYGAIDCGIAMLHIELGAAKCGVYGDWQFREMDKLFVPFDIPENT
jgi:nitroreductase